MSLVNSDDLESFLLFVLKTEHAQYSENPMPSSKENMAKVREYSNKVEELTAQIAKREGIK